MIIAIDFIKTAFPDKKACYAFLEKVRWSDDYSHCSYCNTYNITPRKNELRYQCNECGSLFSVLSLTVFQGTSVELQKWFVVILLTSIKKPPVNITQLARDLNIQWRTAESLIYKISKAKERENNFLLKLQNELLSLFEGYHLT